MEIGQPLKLIIAAAVLFIRLFYTNPSFALLKRSQTRGLIYASKTSSGSAQA